MLARWWRRHARDADCGTVTAEFAVVLPCVAAVAILVLCLGRASIVSMNCQDAAAAGARAMAIDAGGEAKARAAAQTIAGGGSTVSFPRNRTTDSHCTLGDKAGKRCDSTFCPNSHRHFDIICIICLYSIIKRCCKAGSYSCNQYRDNKKGNAPHIQQTDDWCQSCKCKSNRIHFLLSKPSNQITNDHCSRKNSNTCNKRNNRRQRQIFKNICIKVCICCIHDIASNRI